MAHIIADRIADTSTTTGTGNITVANAPPTGFETLNTVLSASDTFDYMVQHQVANEWEVGVGTYSGSHVFVRTTVQQSSNSDSAVNFSSGTKDVLIVNSANRIKNPLVTTLTIGSSVPFSDSSGTLTLQNVDLLDATTESTIEAAIDTLGAVTFTGVISADDSTSTSAPVYSFDGDSNTGIGHPAADTLAISTGGSERLRIDSSGNVSIGATSALSKFHVKAGTDQNLYVGSGSVLGWINDAGSVWVGANWNGATQTFSTGAFASNTGIHIDANGLVGVGTTSPTVALTVNGPIGLKSYTVGTVPSASTVAGQFIYVSNETGGAVPAYSDGSNWRRVTDRAIIS